MGALTAAFLAEIGLITYRDLAGKNGAHTINGLPLPSDYLAAVMLFGALGLVGRNSDAAKFSAVLGWGFVVATAFNLTPALLNPSGSKGQGPAPQKGPVTATGQTTSFITASPTGAPLT